MKEGWKERKRGGKERGECGRCEAAACWPFWGPHGSPAVFQLPPLMSSVLPALRRHDHAAIVELAACALAHVAVPSRAAAHEDVGGGGAAAVVAVRAAARGRGHGARAAALDASAAGRAAPVAHARDPGVLQQLGRSGPQAGVALQRSCQEVRALPGDVGGQLDARVVRDRVQHVGVVAEGVVPREGLQRHHGQRPHVILVAHHVRHDAALKHGQQHLRRRVQRGAACTGQQLGGACGPAHATCAATTQPLLQPLVRKRCACLSVC
mmetsp:Transcript_5535/g.13741  ORF Transcript_5535/g.13741 Transcript_5535/m.13741 type:complete len:266 (-) Transcript_5535:784-1581(-)